jgi:hypothetical protein
VNNARVSIIQLTKPLADIAKNINDNIKVCENQKQRLEECKSDIQELKRNLYTPVIDIVSKPLAKSRTVCGHNECCEKKSVNGVVKEHYKQICHTPCYLTIDDGSMMGNKGLLDCDAFNKYTYSGPFAPCDPNEVYPDYDLKKINADGLVLAADATRVQSELCLECKHSYQTHLHTFYSTRLVNRKIRDENKYERITTKEEAVRAKREQIREPEKQIKELKSESKKISESSAKFAYFLKNHAIISINDIYEEYIKYLLANEEYRQSQGDDHANVQMLQKMLDMYREEKQIIEEAMASSGQESESQITPESISKSIKDLFKLKHNGQAIKDHLLMQESIRSQAH